MPKLLERRTVHLAGMGLVAVIVALALAPALPTDAYGIRMALVTVILLLLPGTLLRRAVLRANAWSGPSRLALDISLSVALCCCCWVAARALGGSLSAFAVGMILIIWAELGWHAVWRRPNDRALPALTGRAGYLPIWIIAGVAGFWCIVTFGHGALFMAETDNWYYLASIQRMVGSGLLLPGDPFFAGAPDPVRGSPWLTIPALAAWLGGGEPAMLWDLLPAALVVVAVCAYFLLGESLFQDRLPAALSCVFLLYGFGRYTWDMPMMVVAPAGVASILCLAAWALSWEALERRTRAASPLAVLLVAATASIHLLVAAGYVLLLAAYTVLMILVRPDRGKARTAGLLLVGATLALALCAGNWFGAGAAASRRYLCGRVGSDPTTCGIADHQAERVARRRTVTLGAGFRAQPAVVITGEAGRMGALVAGVGSGSSGNSVQPVFRGANTAEGMVAAVGGVAAGASGLSVPASVGRAGSARVAPLGCGRSVFVGVVAAHQLGRACRRNRAELRAERRTARKAAGSVHASGGSHPLRADSPLRRCHHRRVGRSSGRPTAG